MQPLIHEQLSEDVVNFTAQGLTCLLQFFEQPRIDGALPRLTGYEVPKVADLCLTNAMDSSETLLQSIWIPWCPGTNTPCP